MSCQKHKELLERWWNDLLTADEREDLAAQLAECEDCKRELEGSRELWDLMGYMPVPEPSGEMQGQFNAMLDSYKISQEGRRRPRTGGLTSLWALFVNRPGVAAGFSLLLLLVGVGLGLTVERHTENGGGRIAGQKLVIRDTVYAAEASPKAVTVTEAGGARVPDKGIAVGQKEPEGEKMNNHVKTVADRRPTAESRQLEALTAQVHEMRELMMLSLLQNPAASERIKAVSYTSEIRHADPNITAALLSTLDNDPNVNVRLTTLEALTHYADDPVIREGLVQSILQQDSPLVQAALADVMLKLQEKRAISPFKKLLQQKDLDETVRTKIEQTIVRLT